MPRAHGTLKARVCGLWATGPLGDASAGVDKVADLQTAWHVRNAVVGLAWEHAFLNLNLSVSRAFATGLWRHKPFGCLCSRCLRAVQCVSRAFFIVTGSGGGEIEEWDMQTRQAGKAPQKKRCFDWENHDCQRVTSTNFDRMDLY